LAVGQAELFDGVHLPDLVRLLGRPAAGVGFAAGRRRWLPATAEPALQGAHAGEVGEFGVQAPQTQTQIRRSPGRMLVVQQQGLVDHRGGGGRHRTLVSGTQSGLAPLAKGAAKTADGAGGELQALGDDAGRLALSPEGPDAWPPRIREGCRHATSKTTAKREGKTRQAKNIPGS
jgi:hypothetical protein